MKTIVLPKNELLAKAASSVINVIRNKPDAVLLLSWDENISELYKYIAKNYSGEKLSSVQIVQASEFDGGPFPLSAKLHEDFILPMNIPSDHFYDLQKDLEKQKRIISEIGGIDLCILSLGVKSQIFFNEPGAAFSSVFRKQKLSDSTKNLFADYCGGLSNVAEYGFTAGIKDVISSKKIIVFSSGAEYSDAVFSMLYARNDSVVPSAFLQIPLNVEIYADYSAAEKC